MRGQAPALLMRSLVAAGWRNDGSYGGTARVMNIVHRLLNNRQKPQS
jgi:hypothetical protein